VAILGIGIDIVKIERVEKALERWGDRFVKRILSKREIECIEGIEAPLFVASRFAAKEAMVKAMGTGFSQGVGFKDIEITREDLSPPIIRVYGSAREICNDRGVEHIHLSISHEKDMACAVVIIEGTPPGRGAR